MIIFPIEVPGFGYEIKAFLTTLILPKPELFTLPNYRNLSLCSNNFPKNPCIKAFITVKSDEFVKFRLNFGSNLCQLRINQVIEKEKENTVS
jgi:hypothetical protein